MKSTVEAILAEMETQRQIAETSLKSAKHPGLLQQGIFIPSQSFVEHSGEDTLLPPQMVTEAIGIGDEQLGRAGRGWRAAVSAKIGNS